MTVLPPELWHLIAGFVPENDLRNLMAVNRVFYELALDIRYREIKISAVDSEAVQLMRRLLDPTIAARVTKLNIISTTPNGSSDSGSVVQNIRSKVSETLQIIRFSLFSPIHVSLDNQLTTLPAVPADLAREDATELFVSVLPGLTNLRRLTVDYWDPPATYDLPTVLQSAWPAVGSNLRTLFIGGHLSTFKSIIDSNPAIPILEEIILQLTDPFLQTMTETLDILNNIIAPFINSFAPTLEMFMLWSWSSLDVSSLFENLGIFPNMKHIRVRVPFNKALKSDPSGLTRFIHNHATTLEELQLWLNPTAAAADHTLDTPLSQWLFRTMSNVQGFPQMKELQFYPTRLQRGFDALILAVTRSVDCLTTLVVRDLYLSDDQVVVLLRTLAPEGPHRLRSLRINIVSFQPVLLNLMAIQLPELHSLTLYLGDSQPESATIASQMKDRVHERWNLYNIGVWKSGHELDSASMTALGRSIPSVRSFWNKGHMNVPGDPVVETS